MIAVVIILVLSMDKLRFRIVNIHSVFLILDLGGHAVRILELIPVDTEGGLHLSFGGVKVMCGFSFLRESGREGGR